MARGCITSWPRPYWTPCALKHVQVRDVVPTCDGDEVKAQDWVLCYARWEQDVEMALGEGKLIKMPLMAMPKDVADPINKRVIRRNLSYAQVKGGVLREVNRRVNRNVPNHAFHGLTVLKNCSVGELSNFMEDFIYPGSQVQEGVTFGHARQRILDALVHHDGLIYKMYNEENKLGGLEFTYLTLYRFCQVELRPKDAVKRHQDHQKWRSLPLEKRPNVSSLNFIGAEPVDEQVNAIGESEAPPKANDAHVFGPPDGGDEWCLNAIGQPVPKEGPKCPFCGFTRDIWRVSVGKKPKPPKAVDFRIRQAEVRNRTRKPDAQEQRFAGGMLLVQNDRPHGGSVMEQAPPPQG